MYAISNYSRLGERYFLYMSLLACNMMMSFSCRNNFEYYGRIDSVGYDGFYVYKRTYMKLKSGKVSTIDTLNLLNFDDVIGYRIIDRGGDS